MPSTYTTRNRLEKQAPGENSNTWGADLNDNTIDLADEAADGVESFTLSGSKTLSTNDGATDEARNRVLNITGGTGGTITIPNVEKLYLVRNRATGAVTFTTGSGTTAVVAAETNAIIVSVGGNVIYNIGPTTFREVNSPSSSRNLAADDASAVLRLQGSSGQTITIPPFATIPFPAFTEIDIVNDTTSTKTVARGSGVTLTYGGTNKDLTLAVGGFAKIKFLGTDAWMAWGTGIS